MRTAKRQWQHMLWGLRLCNGWQGLGICNGVAWIVGSAFGPARWTLASRDSYVQYPCMHRHLSLSLLLKDATAIALLQHALRVLATQSISKITQQD